MNENNSNEVPEEEEKDDPNKTVIYFSLPNKK
jgi:hypothetical protein